MFFEKSIEDKEKPIKIDLEFGRSSFYGGENLMYFVISGELVIVDRQTGREIYDAMMRLGAYFGFDGD
jgi:hypothetical protein